ncbi:MAG TPA: helix-turn-helix domain-containing protein [Bryobacteraceae bacterium]|nr:helix-turn-helix domain-containing protein [Bryobacteraceae bacterium]
MARGSLKFTVLQSRDAIELLSDKWRIALLHLLEKGPLRNHEMQSAIEEVSPKMLTQTLRGMERDGLITRTVHRASPRRVEYRLTEMGSSVIAPIRRLCHWAKAHIAERDAARARFDVAANASRRVNRPRFRRAGASSLT